MHATNQCIRNGVLAKDDEPRKRYDGGTDPDEADDCSAAPGTRTSPPRRRNGTVALDGHGHQCVDGSADADSLQVRHQLANDGAQHPSCPVHIHAK